MNRYAHDDWFFLERLGLLNFVQVRDGRVHEEQDAEVNL